MKICLPMFEFGRAGGMRALSLFANEWIKLGHDVTFMCHTSSPEPYFPTIATIEYYDDDGCPCPISSKKKSRHRSIYANMLSLYRALNKIEKKFDIAIANFWPTSFSLKYSQLSARKFYYIQAYEPGFFTGSGRHARIARTLSKRSYRLGLEMVVNARTYYDYANIESTRLALPPVDLSVFHPKAYPGLIENKIVKLGMIGRNIGWKGGDYVLHAFKSLQKNRNDDRKYQLHVAFGAPELVNQPDVYVCSPQNDSELAAFYRDIDIFIAVPTLQYGAVHYPVLEALASGTPLITTGYYPATSANSWLVAPHSAEAIAATIKSVVADPQLSSERSVRGLVDPQENCATRVAKQFLSYFD